MFGFIKKLFIGLLRFMPTKCMPLNNEQCKTRPFLINLNPLEVKYYPFLITLDKCNGNCNTLNNISDKICVPNGTEDKNLNVFNLLTKTINNNDNNKIIKNMQM